MSNLLDLKQEIKDNVWIEVNLPHLLTNLSHIRHKVGSKTRILSVVKANGYGHGVQSVAKCLSSFVDCFGVAQVQEADSIREAGVDVPVLIFGIIREEDVERCIENDYAVVVSSLEHAKKLHAYADVYQKPLKVHVKVDTGMGRMGVVCEDALSLVLEIKDLPFLLLEGLMTHCPVADDSNDPLNKVQINLFQSFIKQVEDNRIQVPFYHMANSDSLFNSEESHFNMVRPGLSLYGISKFTDEIIPVLELKTQVHLKKKLPKGHTVSYGCHFTMPDEGFVGVLPIGYGQGYPYALSNKSRVLIRGVYYPVVGNVCMDQIIIYLGNKTDVQENDEVVLIGTQGKNKITVSELAEKANTIPYEILTGLSEKIPRFYIDE